LEEFEEEKELQGSSEDKARDEDEGSVHEAESAEERRES
jgi:hypothetical protein